MPAIGENLPIGLAPTPTETELQQRDDIVRTMLAVAIRMTALAPPAPQRHWYSPNGAVAKGEVATYRLTTNPDVEMSTWLETVNWSRGFGPSRRKAPGNEVEINLYTKARALGGVFDGKKGPTQRQALVNAGQLTVYLNEIFSLNLLGLPYDKANTVLNSIDETLDHIVQA
jgi:hypothetical protein